MAEGADRERYLEQAIRDYGDCFYGDGVQVGALARYYLAKDLVKKDQKDKADALWEELRSKFPGAIDHDGSLLATEEP
jgi:hypothetical protein